MRSSLFIFFIFINLAAQSQDDCKLKLDKKGIKVYACPRADSKYKTIKTTFRIKSTLPQLAAALLDIDRYGDWNYKTLSVRTLEKVGDDEVVYYTEVEAPVMTSNRDFVIRLMIAADPKTKGMIVEAVSEPERIPHKEKVVRVPYSNAKWVITPAAKGELNVEYTIDIDLGGSVPPWMVNMFAEKAPYETFKALREVIGNYKGKGVSFLK